VPADPLSTVAKIGLRASEHEGALVIDVVVQPRASREAIGPVQGDRLRVAVSAPPVEGAANAAVVRALAEALGVPRGAVEIVRGRTGRRKTVRIRGVNLATLERALA